MEFYIQQFIEWLQTLSPLSIYLMFGFIAYLENVVPPIPGDVLVAFGGYLAAESIVSFGTVLWVTMAASVLGFMSMYAVGRYFGGKIEQQRSDFWLMKVLNIKYFDKGKRWMDRWGQWVIVANRFLAGTRSVISITAGLTGTKIYRTIASASVSSLIWNGILLLLGWIVHENWQVIGHYLNIYGWFILGIIALVVLGRLIYTRHIKGSVVSKD